MKIELKETTVRELVEGYEDNDEAGVVGYGGGLDIRPPYQREFIYGIKQRAAVIDSVRKNFPLNVMYWAVREGKDDPNDPDFEVIDGQQRTISICQYVESDFAVDDLYFHNLTDDQQQQILDYKLMVYRCSGTDSERLEWFKTINIAGAELTAQELRNAVYAGSWVTDAKRYFSRTGCPAIMIGSGYLAGKPIRQDYLETAIKWINDGDVEGYMAKNQHKPRAQDLWLHFNKVIDWVEAIFPKYRSEMKGINWGALYTDHYDDALNPDKLENEVASLMVDVDVQNKKGIYTYVLDGEDKNLNIRAFDSRQRREAYERQKGICAICGGEFQLNEMEADHITPWREGGKTIAVNCQMLCREDNRRKGAK